MTRPNILFILADDLGWNDLSVEGSDFYESPNIDRIANEGMRFTQGYAACQVCSPSRGSILTGKYTPRHGITDYIGAPAGEDWRKMERSSKLLPPEYERGLRSDEVTFAEALHRAGYRTFFAGKWHLGKEEACAENHGFEVNLAGWDGGFSAGGYFAPYKNPKLPDGPDGESLPVRLGRETARFIAEHKDEPWLAYLSFYSVHGPIQTSVDRWEKYRKKAVAQKKAGDCRFVMDRYLPVRLVQDCPVYAGMIEAMDDAVGIVLDTLDRLGLDENTIVCFTSDNGGVSSGDSFSTSLLPLRGGKGRQWEGGIREPFHVRAPGVTKPGSTCDVPVSGIDYYPTLLELAGIDIPAEQVVDGLSFARLLRGKSDRRLAKRDLFWHYPHYGNQGGEPSSIIRSGQWKLIRYYEDGHEELYNLKTDPGEQNDVIAQNSARAKKLGKRLTEWLEQTGATFPVPDPEHDPEKEQTYLDKIVNEWMPSLEKEHADYLDPSWQPNEDWWGSRIIND
jgi:arylsulfatase A-like enzyme